MTMDAATRRQVDAADPAVSTWLAANAGSGKTRVLTDRVARLLLGGASPQGILCLTYTKAAASEMQNRLFARLGEWSMLDDTALRRKLAGLGADAQLDSERLAHARTLFARAIETPGGLRIQTIHSFCASLLRRFPLEAGVSPVFREMDDRAARLMRDEIVQEMADGGDRDAVADVARHYTGADFGKFLAEITAQRAAFDRPLGPDDIWRHFGLPPGFGDADLAAQTLLGGESALIRDLVRALRAAASPTDRKAAERLAAIDMTGPARQIIAALIPIFLTQSGGAPFTAKIGKFPTKATRAANPALVDPLERFMQRIEAARTPLISLYSAEKTLALHRFAHRFLTRYRARKDSLGLLDFDDLIGRAIALLSNPDSAQWVLYRIDGGIDHILVDEAQDTSPDQWKVIDLLAQEFGAGLGARDGTQRTIFVVGDLKQSIYSFQGADPKEFNRMKARFGTRLSAIGETLCEHSLDYSFRSSPAILDFVDATFRAAGHVGLGTPSMHLAFFDKLPGRVDLWPPEPAGDKPEDKQWFDPTDMLAANDPTVTLAEKIAAHIEDAVKTGSIPGENGEFRPIRFDDFLILVQRRSPLFHEIVRACKARGLPMAGADRLRIGAEMAVRDLTALLSFLVLPEDSLSLAAALRSPLFGLSESDLFDIAHPRPEADLWPALRRHEKHFAETVRTLEDLRAQVDYLKPYDLLERILTRHGGRERLLARLGPEAEDGIDALLSQALLYEQGETPSVTGFVLWSAAADTEIKREADTSGGRIRIMTTHGAKGLESPIVILPDVSDWSPRAGQEILLVDGIATWRPPAPQLTEAATQALAASRAAQEEERMRLLYVALTRAEKWLIICSAKEAKADGNSWYRLARTGLETLDATALATPAGVGLRYQRSEWQDAPRPTIAPAQDGAATLPPWVTAAAPAPPERPAPVSPSDMEGPKSLPDPQAQPQDDARTMRHGSQVHLLLEHLPDHARDLWPTVAAQVLTGDLAPQTPTEMDALLQEATRVLTAPELAEIFAPDTLAEVEIAGTMPTPPHAPVRGTIDRLVVTDEKVMIVDFKSNRLIPDTPAAIPLGILRQMGVYYGVIREIYPDRQVVLAVLWTRSATLMEVPADLALESLVAGRAP